MKASPDVRWDSALALIRENVTQQQYDTWFSPIVFESFDEDKKALLVQVPSPFVYEYLEENYIDLLIKVLRRTFCPGIRLNYRVVTDKEHKLSQDIEADPVDIDKPNARTRANESPTVLDAAQPQQLDPQLNPHLSFSNYIEGDSNKLPRSVGMSIADHPNTTQFNPCSSTDRLGVARRTSSMPSDCVPSSCIRRRECSTSVPVSFRCSTPTPCSSAPSTTSYASIRPLTC